jgi:hypothetical protein
MMKESPRWTSGGATGARNSAGASFEAALGLKPDCLFALIDNDGCWMADVVVVRLTAPMSKIFEVF